MVCQNWNIKALYAIYVRNCFICYTTDIFCQHIFLTNYAAWYSSLSCEIDNSFCLYIKQIIIQTNNNNQIALEVNWSHNITQFYNQGPVNFAIKFHWLIKTINFNCNTYFPQFALQQRTILTCGQSG